MTGSEQRFLEALWGFQSRERKWPTYDDMAALLGHKKSTIQRLVYDLCQQDKVWRQWDGSQVHVVLR